jgi:hypothetical protein
MFESLMGRKHKTRQKWEDSIKTGLKDIRCEDVNRIDPARAFMNTVINLRIPPEAGNFVTAE